MNKLALSFCAALFAMATSSANAALFLYDDRSDFIADTGATDATGPLTTGTGTMTRGTLTFSAHTGSSAHLNSFNTLMAGNEFALSGNENFNIDISGSVFSMGFDFVEPTSNFSGGGGFNGSGSFIHSEFAVTLFSGAASIGSFNFMRPFNSLEFVGFWSTTAFDRIEVREIVGSNGNEFFNAFITGTTAHVPAPGALLLLGFGLIGFGAARRK